MLRFLGNVLKMEDGWKIYENLGGEGEGGGGRGQGIQSKVELCFFLGRGIGTIMATMNQLIKMQYKFVEQFRYNGNFGFRWIGSNFFIKVILFSIYNYFLNSNQIWMKLIGYSLSWWSMMLVFAKRIWSEKGTCGSNQWY